MGCRGGNEKKTRCDSRNVMFYESSYYAFAEATRGRVRPLEFELFSIIFQVSNSTLTFLHVVVTKQDGRLDRSQKFSKKNIF